MEFIIGGFYTMFVLAIGISIGRSTSATKEDI